MTPSELPPSWAAELAAEFDKPYFKDLVKFLAKERKTTAICPPSDQVFAAFHLTPFEDVRVLILGQDPYHGPGQAHGLAFSVPDGVAVPPSLANLFKELASDQGCPIPESGSLLSWAQKGVLLLNAVLTVKENEAGSHQKQGWETFTDAVIKALSARREPLVFVLWGGYAKKKAKLIDKDRHRVLEGVHPSPLSAYQGFFGSKPFSTINQLLSELGHPPLDWTLSDLPLAKAPSAVTPGRSMGPIKRGRVITPSNPSVVTLGENLRRSQRPDREALAKALQRTTWDSLTPYERDLTAQAVLSVLPAGFAFQDLATYTSGGVVREVALFAFGPSVFALCPSGECKLGGEERTMHMAPFVMEVAPLLRGADLEAQEEGVGLLGRVERALLRSGFALPTSDEWEYAHKVGATSAAASSAPNALGLCYSGEWELTNDPDLYRGGDRGDLLSQGSRELTRKALVRRVRRIFPYADLRT